MFLAKECVETAVSDFKMVTELPQSNRKLLTRASNGSGVDVGVSKRSSSGAVMRKKSMCLGLEG